MTTFRLICLALLTAQSLALFGLENMLSLPLPAPGAKLGLANIVTLFALYALPRPRDALLILSLRILLAAIFFGGPSVFLYSMVGGAASFATMLALKKSNLFSIGGVSAAGGFTHNFAQLSIAVLLADTTALWNYMPVLGGMGIFSGLTMGFIVEKIWQSRYLRELVEMRFNANL